MTQSIATASSPDALAGSLTEGMSSKRQASRNRADTWVPFHACAYAGGRHLPGGPPTSRSLRTETSRTLTATMRSRKMRRASCQ